MLCLITYSKSLQNISITWVMHVSHVFSKLNNSLERLKQLGSGKKSVTMRVRFRDESRTLRHEEVDPQMDRLAEKAKQDLGAEIRA